LTPGIRAGPRSRDPAVAYAAGLTSIRGPPLLLIGAGCGMASAQHHGQTGQSAQSFDVQFIDMMVPHHQGAIRMARIQIERGQDPELTRLSREIIDAQTREILQQELQQVWQETRNTFVFVTHNVREAVFLADRVVLMSAPPGTLVAEHRISVDRPREFEDVLLSKVVVDIHDHLHREVEKVVAREIGDRPAVA
jgi:ABC-type taurine transport system ATPase subunit